MIRQDPTPDADFDLMRTGFKEACADVARLEAGADRVPEPAERVMLRFGAGLPQNADGLHEAWARADARRLELQRSQSS